MPSWLFQWHIRNVMCRETRTMLNNHEQLLRQILNPTELEIEEKYSAIYQKNGSPKWAVNIEPAIPFVGNDYYKMPAKCLIYGSAENLTYLSGNQISSNNYRRNREVKEAGNFFKNIHITPISDGSLLTVSRFILAKLGYDKQFSCDPRTFIEQVAISNFGKFSQNTDSNEDYAGKLKYLRNSFEFIKTDIGLLIPKCRLYLFGGSGVTNGMYRLSPPPPPL